MFERGSGYRPMTQWVYGFGGGRAEGTAAMKALLGGKGANLAEMSNLGLPVPPGFTISTEVCTWFYANDRTYPDDLTAQVDRGLACGRAASWACASATWSARSWSRCAPVPRSRCRA